MHYLVGLDRLLRRIEFGVALVALVIIVFSTATGVFTRSVLNAQIIWTSELSVLAQVWLTFIGASAIYKERGHIGISGLVEALPAGAARLLTVLRDLALAGLMIVFGLAVLNLMNLQWEQSLSTLGVPRALTSLPVAWAIFSIAFSALVSAIAGEPGAPHSVVAEGDGL